MRVVAGAAKGRILRAPAGRTTRPTSDRVREAIFSILSSLVDIEGLDVLDLFAGSGALGIEALSRGAASATFVDKEPAAVRAIRANLAVLGGGTFTARVVRADAVKYVTSAPYSGLVLADPPYSFTDWPALLGGLSGTTGTLVAETGSPWEPGPAWETVTVKKYGDTVVTVAQPVALPDAGLFREGES